jgi:hypothetical protein
MTMFSPRVAMKALLTAGGVCCLLAGMSTAAWAGAVPEIDAGSLTSGLAVMAGMTLVITGRRRKSVEPPDRGGN